MSATISVTYVSTLPSTTSTAVIPIPSGVQGLDSGQNAANQTGTSAFDVMLAAIAKNRGIRFVDAAGTPTFVPIGQIVKVTTP